MDKMDQEPNHKIKQDISLPQTRQLSKLSSPVKDGPKKIDYQK